MIRLVNRSELDVERYNKCVSNSKNAEVYAFSWYLDIVSDNWSAYILDEYQAVMPIPIRKKYGIPYVYQPLWTLHLGIFGDCDLLDFIQCIRSDFKHVSIRLTPKNLKITSENYQKKRKQILKLGEGEKVLSLRKDRKKDLKKAKDHGLLFSKTNNVEHVIQLFKNNVGQRVKNIKQRDYDKLNEICSELLKRELGSVYEVYDGKALTAGAFVIIFQKRASILFSSTDFKNRGQGSNTFLISQIYKEIKDSISTFDFGGSSIDSIAAYFESFGASNVNYPMLTINRLPFPLNYIKK